SELVDETLTRLEIAWSQNTAVPARAQRHQRFRATIAPQVLAYNQRLTQQLLASGSEPDGFALPCATCAPRPPCTGKPTCPCCRKNTLCIPPMSGCAPPKRCVGREKPSPSRRPRGCWRKPIGTSGSKPGA